MTPSTGDNFSPFKEGLSQRSLSMSRINATKNSRRVTNVMRLPNGSERKA